MTISSPVDLNVFRAFEHAGWQNDALACRESTIEILAGSSRFRSSFSYSIATTIRIRTSSRNIYGP
jgi:hypothetical protein